VNYLLWLLGSAVFFTFGEYFSKKFATSSDLRMAAIAYASYSGATLCWFPALFQKNHLILVGTIWSVSSLIITVILGIAVFDEKLTARISIGLFLAFASILFLTVE
jgi:multidrug transporter EmrE-like cation transporter